jgi:hypothetical protein
MSTQKLIDRPQVAIGGDEEAVVVISVDFEELFRLARRFEEFATVLERNDLVAAAVDDEQRQVDLVDAAAVVELRGR